VAGSVLQIAAQRGDAALWETFRQRFETAQNPAERRRFLEALGSFGRPELREKSLAYALTGPLKPQETLSVPRTVGEIDEDGRVESFDWMTKNYSAILARIPPMIAVFMPYIGAGCSSERLAKVQEFFAEPDHAPAGTEKEMARLTETVEDCVTLRQREGERVRAYLNRTGVAN
jgi:alanyl aminopeptidase